MHRDCSYGTWHNLFLKTFKNLTRVYLRIRYLKLSSDHKDANYTRKTIICDSSIVMKNNGPQNKGRLITLTNDAADKRVFRLELGHPLSSNFILDAEIQTFKQLDELFCFNVPAIMSLSMLFFQRSIK